MVLPVACASVSGVKLYSSMSEPIEAPRSSEEATWMWIFPSAPKVSYVITTVPSSLTVIAGSDLGRLDQIGAHKLIRHQVNPVRAGSVLLANQHIDMCAGLIGCYGRNIAAEVVDVGEPVVRGLRAGRHVAKLGRHAAVDNDSADDARAVEIPGHAAISGTVQIVGYLVDAAAASPGTDPEDAIHIAGVVGGNARPRIDGIAGLWAFIDWVIDREAGAVVIGDGDAFCDIQMEIVIGHEDSCALQRNPRLIRVSSRCGRIDARPAACIVPRGKRGRVGGGALVDVAVGAEDRPV